MTLLLRVLAIAFTIGAVIAGVIGYRLSNQPEAAAPPLESYVETIQPLKAGEAIPPQALTVKQAAARPAGSYAGLEQVIGKVPNADLPAGTALTRTHFAFPNQLQPSLRNGERAVAIKVDEIVGLGGFARPGDLVDILLYLRPSPETKNDSTAQVLLAGVRLLAFGEAVQGRAAESATEEAVGRAQERVSNPRQKTFTSAVIAVPEADASRLMLAANSGNLRLSLRPAESKPGDKPENYLVKLNEMVAPSRPAAKPTDGKPAKPAAPPVLIYEGDSVRPVARFPR